MENIPVDRKIFLCNMCTSKKFKTRMSAAKHYEKKHYSKVKSVCKVCPKSSSTIKNPIYHSKRHITMTYKCRFCPSSRFFPTLITLQEHYTKSHQTPDESLFDLIESAFKKRVLTFQTKFKFQQIQNLEILKLKVFHEIKALLRHQLSLKRLIKFSLVVGAEYVKFDELGKVKSEETIFLRTSARPLLLNDLNHNQLGKRVEECFVETTYRNERFTLSGSGWSMSQIKFINVEIAKLSFAGGCSNIRVRNMKNCKTKYLINPETLSNECFTNAVAMSYLPKSTLNLPSKKQGILAREYTKQHFNIKGLKFPMSLQDIRKFELKNRNLKLQINIMTIWKGELIPIHKSSTKKPKKVINLFLQRTSRTGHFFLISNLSKFLQKGNNRYFCQTCLLSFSSDISLKNHVDLCRKNDAARIVYPADDDPGVRFKSYTKTVMQPLFATADFESTLNPIKRKENGVKYNCDNCKEEGDESKCKHKTSDINHQMPTTYSIALVDNTGKLLFEKTESDYVNVMRKFYDTLAYIEKQFFPLLQKYKQKNDYTVSENKNFAEATKCYLCDFPFYPHINGRDKVRDHCHYSSKYLGAAHSRCNWYRRVQWRIPIYVHNFQNYDSHFILQGLKYVKKTDNIRGIPYNMEKFRTLEIGKFTFIDSLHLLPASLDTLVNNLNSDATHQYPILDQVPIFNKKPLLRKELLKKGSYPYEWATSVVKLVQTKKIPKHKYFYSKLKQANITIEEHKRAKNIFKGFKLPNMLAYTQFYCKLDVILLAEVMHAFRNMVMTTFNLDVCQYISAPQLAFDAMLKQLDEPIQRMTDPDMILMCESNIRGGVSFVAERHAHCECLEKEINKKVKNETESERAKRINDTETDTLFALDANNLYSVAQSSLLPWGNYEWCDGTEIQILTDQILNVPDSGDVGFILDCDLQYGSELHKKHSSFPLLPEKKEFQFSDLSPVSQSYLKTINGEKEAKRYKSEKLVTDVTDKKNYVLHYRNLKTYLKAGVKLKKINRAIKFTQKKFLKSYIEKCTAKRANAKTEFEKMLFKLFMNSVYGKFLQNNRKHSEVCICRKYSHFAKQCHSPLYTGHRILDENVTAVFRKKEKVLLDRLYPVGFSILELSKNHMYETWYEFMLPNLGEENVNIVLTDTDSLLIHAKGMSRNQFFDCIDECMDYSNYPPDHPRFSNANKARPGYFKDENKGNYLTEVIGLKSKCYITKVIDKNSKTKSKKVVCKGIQKATREKLTLKHFRKIVSRVGIKYAETHAIRSKKHQLYTQKLKKVALTSFDDKRLIQSCGLHTLPYGSIETLSCQVCV